MSFWMGTGNLGKDPERKELRNGSTVIKARMAVQQGKDKDPMWLDVTVWHDEHPAAGKALADCEKGRRIDVRGRLTTREYDGRTYVEVTADHVRPWPPRDGGRQQSQQRSRGGGWDSPSKHHQGERSSGHSGRNDIPYNDDEDIPF